MLPSLQFFEQIQHHIFSIPNKRKETKRREHYCLFLLGQKAGLRVSEAIRFDLSAKRKKGLYQITKTKGKKERFAYIPKQVINELEKHRWKPNSTNRFNFYHFLRKIKREINLPANVELTPHTLRRSFATFNAEAGLPLPLLSKMLGHSSVRTTALYWMNTYHGGDDDDDSDTGAILCGKNWLEEHEPAKPDSETPIISEIPPQPERISLLIEPASQQIVQLTNALSNYQHQLTKKDQQISQLTTEKDTLQNDLDDLSEQNATLRQEFSQAITNHEQFLAEKDKTIKHLEQELTNEQAKRIAAENNLSNSQQQLQAEQENNQSLKETNTNLTQKLHAYEQNYSNLQNAYQIALKDKESTQKQLNQLTSEIKNAIRILSQWQKINYYQQLEKPQLKAQILQREPPPPFK